MGEMCTCEVLGWPDCRRDNTHCVKHARDCGCPQESKPSKAWWCPYIHCPREHQATEWRLFIPKHVPTNKVKEIVEKTGGKFIKAEPNSIYYIDKTTFCIQASWEIVQTMLSLDQSFAAHPDT